MSIGLIIGLVLLGALVLLAIGVAWFDEREKARLAACEHELELEQK